VSGDISETFSTFRLKKGDKSTLIAFALAPDGKVQNLTFPPDHEYF
jgi:hypothetical protein